MNRLDILGHYLEEQASLLILEFDRQERLLKANRHGRQILGPGCIGKPAEQIFVDFGGSFSLRRYMTLPQSAQLLNVTTGSGLPQTYYFSFFEVEDGILCAGQVDSAEMNDLRQDLVQSNNELNNLTRQLQKKGAELARLNELKNQFLGMVAHDLRNPLSAIMGYSELIMLMQPEERDRPDFLELINDIRYLSDFMLSMINDLLDIAVIEAGKLNLRLEPLVFSDLLVKTVKVNAVFAEKKSTELILRDEIPAGLILLDKPRIKQVLNNLLSNAIKFSEPGASVDIHARAVGDWLEVAVIDNGPGITAKDLEKLFAPYPAINARSSGDERRTGLGLAISKKIVDAHQGDIRVESTPGAGSTFTVVLPNFTRKDPFA